MLLTGILLISLGFVAGAWWHSLFDSRRKGIELKNINLEGITQGEQIQKVYEEVNEFEMAVINGDITNAVEEFFDMLQAGLGALQKMGLNAGYVMSQYGKHLEKIKDRPRVKRNERK